MSDVPQVVGRLPPRLVLCPGCGRHVFDHEDRCPHCGALGLIARLAEQAEARARAEAAHQELQALLARLPGGT